MDLEILSDFLIESKELLQKAQEETLLLKIEPGNSEALASIFRAFHIIKGGAFFLDTTHLADWTHNLETLLDQLCSHSLPVTQSRIEAILKGIDVIDQMFLAMAEDEPPAGGPEQLGQTITALARVAGGPDGTASANEGPVAAERSDLVKGATETAHISDIPDRKSSTGNECPEAIMLG